MIRPPLIQNFCISARGRSKSYWRQTSSKGILSVRRTVALPVLLDLAASNISSMSMYSSPRKASRLAEAHFEYCRIISATRRIIYLRRWEPFVPIRPLTLPFSNRSLPTSTNLTFAFLTLNIQNMDGQLSESGVFIGCHSSNVDSFGARVL